ncbi:MAG: methyl-accepting chemotaxis protein [Syntrophorhabdus sp.]|nr:methyl-accepting chemotaxis protein [Syntrophorhabdus sp.]
MRFFENIRIGRRLGIGFAIFIIIIALMALLGFKIIDDVDRKTGNAVEAAFEKTILANTVMGAIYDANNSMGVIAFATDAAVIEAEKENLGRMRQTYGEALAKLETLERDPKGKELIVRFKGTAAKAKDSSERVIEYAGSKEHAKAIETYINENRPAMKEIVTTLQSIFRYQEDNVRSQFSSIRASNRSYTLILIVFGVAAIVLGIILSITITRSIVVPIRGNARAVRAMAKGNLAFEVPTDRKDEFGDEMKAAKEMVERWREILGSLKSAAASISSAGVQLSASAEQMSKGSGEQANRSSQVAAASVEMSQTVVDIARNTNNIANSAANTVKIAKEGEEIVNQATKEVEEIARTVGDSAESIRTLGERSSQIGEIVNVIDDIADQTNLLALNAAIEAARAGEQGRGFAVVADEVRKLAERTANSTSEIGGMINAIQGDVERAVMTMNTVAKKVETGVDLSGKAGQSLRVIVTSVDDLLGMVQQIASATDEMSATSEEINRDIEQIAAVSRETSASSEQTAQASGELAKLSNDLEDIVSRFRV